MMKIWWYTIHCCAGAFGRLKPDKSMHQPNLLHVNKSSEGCTFYLASAPTAAVAQLRLAFWLPHQHMPDWRRSQSRLRPSRQGHPWLLELHGLCRRRHMQLRYWSPPPTTLPVHKKIHTVEVSVQMSIALQFCQMPLHSHLPPMTVPHTETCTHVVSVCKCT